MFNVTILQKIFAPLDNYLDFQKHLPSSLSRGYIYAPTTIVEGHYVFWSVRSFVHSSVHLSSFRLKFLVKVVFDEVEVQLTSNLVHMFTMI